MRGGQGQERLRPSSATHTGEDNRFRKGSKLGMEFHHAVQSFFYGIEVLITNPLRKLTD